MSEQNVFYSNAVLSSTLDSMYRGISGLYDVAVKQNTKLANETSARIAGDQALCGRISALETITGQSGAIQEAITQVETNLTSTFETVSSALSTAISGEISNRINGDQQTLSSAETYTNFVSSALSTGLTTDIATTLQEAKDYADTVTLVSANSYTDSEIEKINSDASGLSGLVNNIKEAVDTLGTPDGDGTLGATLSTKVDNSTYNTKIEQIESAISTKLATSDFNTTIANYATSAQTHDAITAAVDIQSTRAIAKETELESAITGMTSNLSDNYYNKTQIDQKVASVFVWKGSVDSLQNVPESGKVIGNVYQVGTTEYAWTGTQFEQLGLNVDMSLYATVEALNTAKSDAISSAQDKVDALSTILRTDIDAKLATSDFNITIANYATSAQTHDAITAAVKTETDARIEAISAVNADIVAISSIIGGEQQGGESITTRVSALETAIPVSAINDPSAAILVEIGPSGQLEEGSGNWKLNPIYNPGINLSFNNKVIEYGATKIVFAGTVTTTKTADGEVKVQIGENMNSSSWNSNDGKTNGTVTDITTTIGLLNGTSVNATKSQTFIFSSAENIHFDQGNNLWTIIITANNEEIVNANLTDILTCNSEGIPSWQATIITGTGETTAITTSLTNKAREDNYPAAVGGRAKRSFTIDFSKLGNIANKVLKISIQGCGGKFISKEFYYVTAETPVVADNPTLTLNNGVSVYYSGVEYYGLGTTFDFETGTISNLNNQLEVNTSTNKLIFSSTNCAAPTAINGGNYNSGLTGTSSSQDNTATKFAATGLTANSNINTSSISVSITPVNFYTTGTTKTANLTTDKVVNTYTGNSTDTIEYCKAENYRVANTSVINNSTTWTTIKFNSQSALASDELQLIPGVGIKYPSGQTGTRYFTRKFIKAGSLTGSTITFTFSSGNLNNIIVQIMKGENVWVPINKFNGTYSYATAASTTSKLVLSFTDTNADGGYYFRVGMVEGTTAIITKIEMA